MLTYVTTQRASPARAFRAVRTAGRVPDAARRLKSRTRQAFRQTQSAGGTARPPLRLHTTRHPPPLFPRGRTHAFHRERACARGGCLRRRCPNAPRLCTLSQRATAR
jgi:hypothetical protein